jgi:hypothetical protein
MSADEWIRDNCCSKQCLEATTKRSRCRCAACGGQWHGWVVEQARLYGVGSRGQAATTEILGGAA